MNNLPLRTQLGWMLIHSIWQITLIAVALALSLLILNRAKSAVRYALSLVALAASILLPLATFLTTRLLSWSTTTDAFDQSGSFASATTLLKAQASSVLISGTSDPGLGSTAGAAEWTSWLPVVWIMGVTILSLRLVGSIAQVSLWRRRRTIPADTALEALVHRLSARLGLRQDVRVVIGPPQSLPSAWGAFRPIISVPLGLLSGLTESQMEAILLHELAHIRRYDYLVNIVQSAIETLLFYHPAVWWISAVIRREREHCCDDLVVAAVGDPLPYAGALLRLEERRSAFNLSPSPLVQSATGGPFMKRIQRLIGTPQSSSRLFPTASAVATLGIVSALVFGAYKAQAQSAPKEDASGKSPILSPVEKTAKGQPVLSGSDSDPQPAQGTKTDAKKSEKSVTISITTQNSAKKGASKSPDVRYRIDLKKDASGKKIYQVETIGGPQNGKIRRYDAATTKAISLSQDSADGAQKSRIRISLSGDVDEAKFPFEVPAFGESAMDPIVVHVPDMRVRIAPGRAKADKTIDLDLDRVLADVPKITADSMKMAEAAIGQIRIEGLSKEAEAAMKEARKQMEMAKIEISKLDVEQMRKDFATAQKEMRAQGIDPAKLFKPEDMAKLRADLEKMKKDGKFTQNYQITVPDAKSFATVKDLYRIELDRNQPSRGNQSGVQTYRIQDLKPLTLRTTDGQPITVEGSARPLNIQRAEQGRGLTELRIDGTNQTLYGTAIANGTTLRIQVENGIITLDASAVPLSRLLNTLAKQADLSFVIEEGNYRSVTATFKRQKLDSALNLLVKAGNARIRKENGVYYISPK